MGRWSTRATAVIAAVVALGLAPGREASAQSAAGRLAVGPRAVPASEGPPASPAVPVVFSVVPAVGSFRWAFRFSNPSGQAVEIAADRRLVWLEVVPPDAAEPVTPGRARRARRRPVRCVSAARPASAEQSPHVVVQAQSEYAEGFDLRDVCGLALPQAIAPGATLRFHYGFTGRPSIARAVVFDERPTAVIGLDADAAVAVPAQPGDWPPTSPRLATGDDRLELHVLGHPSAGNASSLAIAVELRRPSVYPLRVFYRPGMIRLEVTTPEGRRARCTLGARSYAPVPDFFVRLGHGHRVREHLQLGLLCPREALPYGGTYRAQAVFESNIDRTEYNFPMFSGAVRSQYFYFRIGRGQLRERYRPLPVEDPFTDVADPG